MIIGRLGKYGHPATVAEAQKRFEAHCKGESTIPADLRSAVYSTVLKHGDGNTLESVMQLLKEADLHEEKVRLMRCMEAVSQPDLIKKVCDFSLSVRFIKLCMKKKFFHHQSSVECFNPLNPKSDEDLTSPNNITPESHIKVIRMKEMITNLKKLLIRKQILLVSTLGNV